MTQKLHLLGTEAHYFLKQQLILLRERSLSTQGIRICGFSLCAEHHEVLFLKQVGVLILQRHCHSVEGGEVWGPFERPPFFPWFSEPCDSFECHLSSFTLGFLCRTSLLLPYLFILRGSFQLTHYVSVIRQIWKSKITVNVVSHSFRSMGLLPKIALLDCSAWGIIDQYQVHSLFYIWLVNLTQCANFICSVCSYLRAQYLTYILNCQAGKRRMNGL